MKVRSYCNDNWQEMLRLYNLSFPADAIDELFFVQHLLLNPNVEPDGIFILEKSGKIVGWTCAMIIRHSLDCWGNMPERMAGVGCIMPPAAFNVNDAVTLIAAAEEYLKANNCQHFRCGIFGYTLFPNGVSEADYPIQHEAFCQADYQIKSYSHSMERSLENYSMPPVHRRKIEELATENIIIKSGDVSDLLPLRRMFEGSSMRNWMHLVSRKAEQNKLHEMIVVRRGDEALGYCQYNYFGMTDRVGPFGITDSMRGKGIGRAMIAQLFEVMSQRNIKRAWFASCVEERINFYQQNDLQVFRKKSIFAKEA